MLIDKSVAHMSFLWYDIILMEQKVLQILLEKLHCVKLLILDISWVTVIDFLHIYSSANVRGSRALG